MSRAGTLPFLLPLRKSALRRFILRRRVALVIVSLVGIVVVLTTGVRLLADWLHSGGVGVVGDEPAYLVPRPETLAW